MSGLLVFIGIVCLIYQGIKEAMQPRRKAIKRWDLYEQDLRKCSNEQMDKNWTNGKYY
ncbi:hypothetical protein [uncultured Robinsoniella sp.]|uniref:hypothetical protein n=1 Tax=uncultured Robinsoniella sp. TaxID=904190 RepID=UPI00374EECF4